MRDLKVPKSEWQSSQFHGQGVEWKCKQCGKYSSHIRNGIGVCCSPELQKQETLQREANKIRRDLVWALQSRVLTDDEMAQVARYGYHILVENMVPYNETVVREQFGNMLLLQFKLKVAASGK